MEGKQGYSRRGARQLALCRARLSQQLIRTGVEGHDHDLDLPLYMHEQKRPRIRGISWFFFFLTDFNKAKITI